MTSKPVEYMRPALQQPTTLLQRSPGPAPSNVTPTQTPVDGYSTTTNGTLSGLTTIIGSDRLQRALYIAIADLARQTFGSSDVKLWKAGVVGASSLISQWIIAAPIDALINAILRSDNSTVDYILNILSESLGITVALVTLNMMGVVKSTDIEATTGEPELAPKSKKRGKLMKAFLMAMTDVVLAEVGRYITSMGYLSGSSA